MFDDIDTIADFEETLSGVSETENRALNYNSLKERRYNYNWKAKEERENNRNTFFIPDLGKEDNSSESNFENMVVRREQFQVLRFQNWDAKIMSIYEDGFVLLRLNCQGYSTRMVKVKKEFLVSKGLYSGMAVDDRFRWCTKYVRNIDTKQERYIDEIELKPTPRLSRSQIDKLVDKEMELLSILLEDE